MEVEIDIDAAEARAVALAETAGREQRLVAHSAPPGAGISGWA